MVSPYGHRRGLCVSMRIALQSSPETETTSTPVAAHVNDSQRTKPPSQKFGELTWWPEDGIIYKNHYWLVVDLPL